jgi:outer membrane protein
MPFFWIKYILSNYKDNAMKKTFMALAIIATTGVSATESSSFEWRIGATQVTPHVNSGNIVHSGVEYPNTPTSVTADTQLTGGLTYRLNDQWAVDVPLGLGFNHNIVGQGKLAPYGTIATVKALPITTLMQYRFGESQQAIRPYAGLGVSYVKFLDAQGSAKLDAISHQANTTLSMQSKWAPSAQIGVQFKLTEALKLDVSYIQTYVSTRTTTSADSYQDSQLDPGALTIGLTSTF